MIGANALLLLTLVAPPGPPPGPQSAPAGPMLLALPGGEAVPLLGLRPEEKEGSDPTLEVVYWAGRESASLATVAGASAERARLGRVFEAFRVWSVTRRMSDVFVSAVAGRPAEQGTGLTLRWTRTGPQAWESGEPQRRELALPAFPAPALPATRHARTEDDTRSSALAFLAKLDAGRFADAWRSASELLRASWPREKFERGLQLAARVNGQTRSRTLVFWMYPVASGATSPGIGSLVSVRFVMTTDGR